MSAPPNGSQNVCWVVPSTRPARQSRGSGVEASPPVVRRRTRAEAAASSRGHEQRRQLARAAAAASFPTLGLAGGACACGRGGNLEQAVRAAAPASRRGRETSREEMRREQQRQPGGDGSGQTQQRARLQRHGGACAPGHGTAARKRASSPSGGACVRAAGAGRASHGGGPHSIVRRARCRRMHHTEAGASQGEHAPTAEGLVRWGSCAQTRSRAPP